MDKIEKYNAQILDLFRKSKISSVKINGTLYDDFKQLPSDLEIKELVINKKYIKLFDDEKFILNNYINNKEMLVKNEKTGRYICLKISSHSRIRLLTRYMVLYFRYKDFLGKNIQSIMQDVTNVFIDSYKTYKFTNIKEFKSSIHNFVNENKELLNVAIYKLFSESSTLKNISKKYKDRETKYGYTNHFICYPFVLIYDINNNLVKTIEIHELSKQDINTKKLRQELNKKVNDYSFIMNIVKSRVQ